MEKLSSYGWDHYLRLLGETDINYTNPARVISIKGTKYHLITKEGYCEAELTGKMLYSQGEEDQPKVGDWVECIRFDSQSLITDQLPRVNSLYRMRAGTRKTKQVMASNIDRVLIVQGLDENFNIMRLDRYIAQILSCRIEVSVILNKVDLIEDQDSVLNEVNRLQRNIPVFFCSTLTGEGIKEIRSEVLRENETVIFLGSSGVGKSSLLNTLMPESERKTLSISQATGKGMHTTTTRDLFRLPNGCLVIDTPGMREFAIGFADENDLADLFPIISVYAVSCRFSDCQHIEEAGCAVKAALEDGEIDEVVYQSYLKLIKEQMHFQKTTEDKRREGKRFGKMVREVKRYHRKYKY